MQTLQPDKALQLLETELSVLANEHDRTRKLIEAIPLDKGDYRPDSISPSALDLAWHIAVAENRFLDAVASGAFNFEGGKRPDSVQNSADVSRWYNEAFQKNMARLKELTGEQAAKVIDFRGRMQWPAVMFLRLGMNHAIHHRGQLSMYLRPMGAKVPSIYGESYDDAQARMASQSAS
jgi:uncharacterized damage-inducible protein DinB